MTNAHVITLDPRRPTAEALAVVGTRVLTLGSASEIRAFIGPRTEVIDAEGGTVLPAFHDAHIHLLSYARAWSRLDCHQTESIPELGRSLARHAREHPGAGWIRAVGYDELRLADHRHPDRYDLDLAVPDRPVRLQHRTLHADIFNTIGLHLAELFHSQAPEVERAPTTNEPTGRVFHGAELLRRRLPPGSREDLARDVRAACEQLLSWGVTSVQDASVTNGPEELALFRDLSANGHLPLRVFMMRGAQHWAELDAAAAITAPTREGAGADRRRADQQPDADHARLRLGPVKLMLDERTSDPAVLRAEAVAAHAAGHAVAIHAVSEAEVVIALDILRPLARPAGASPNRIEHGSVIPDELLLDLAAAHIAVIGQPALVAERGDIYRAAYPLDQHAWLHRAASLIRAGILYAIGSDAPIASPNPFVTLAAARTRRTATGHILGPEETLDTVTAYAACSFGPAQAIGCQNDLGMLRPDLLADLVIVEPGNHPPTITSPLGRTVRMTISRGVVAWDQADHPPHRH